MASVMIRCPNTGRAVSTEIETEPCVFRNLPRIAAHMACPACGHEHAWTKDDAWLAAEELPVGADDTAGSEVA